jgi:hypothetical protein
MQKNQIFKLLFHKCIHLIILFVKYILYVINKIPKLFIKSKLICYFSLVTALIKVILLLNL